MPEQYKYQAVTSNGSRRSGTISAPDKSTVESYLQEQQLLPVRISAVQEKTYFSLFGFLKKREYESLIMFTHSLSSLHRAGIPLLRALSVIRVGPEHGRFNTIIDRIRTDVQSGKLLSEAMREFPDVFSNVYVNSVSAGEESGNLEGTLDEVADMLEKEIEITRQIKSGVRYPLMVIGAIVLAFIVLMTFVIPRFVAFYGTFGADLPLPTRVIMGISNFFSGYWPLLLIGVITTAFGARQFMKSETGKHWVDRRLLKLPVFGNLIVKGNIARFSLMFRILLNSGIPIVKSLTILATTVNNSQIGLEIKKLEEMFRYGKETDIISADFEFFPDQALHMIAVGLESGSLDSMLGEIGQYYSKQVFYLSRQLTAIIEPILTLVLGVFILVLALAIFLPMWNLIKVFHS